eukprot:g15924.t1
MQIACGHTDRLHIRQNLLCDRLSQPTAEMVDALIFLQDHKADLQQLDSITTDMPWREFQYISCWPRGFYLGAFWLRHIGETLTQQTQRRHATKELMLATCFCIFFEYLPIAESGDVEPSNLKPLKCWVQLPRQPEYLKPSQAECASACHLSHLCS